MSRRLLLLLPAVLAAIALPVAPALAGGPDPDAVGEPPAVVAGEDDPVDPAPAPAPAPEPALAPVVRVGIATLHAKGCVARARTTAMVTGELIDSVAYYVDGKLVKTVDEPDSSGRYAFAMRCAHLRAGAHRAKAVVSFEQGTTPAGTTLRFQITRASRSTPRFAG